MNSLELIFESWIFLVSLPGVREGSQIWTSSYSFLSYFRKIFTTSKYMGRSFGTVSRKIQEKRRLWSILRYYLSLRFEGQKKKPENMSWYSYSYWFEPSTFRKKICTALPHGSTSSLTRPECVTGSNICYFREFIANNYIFSHFLERFGSDKECLLKFLWYP